MTDRMTAPPSGVKIRMYRQGLGDCFLLAFPHESGRPFYLMIDCGVIVGTPDPGPIMQRVAQDIHEATGGEIDVLAITHEHWDHLSGFVQANEDFAKLTFRNVWFAWTQDPNDKLANQLRTEFAKTVAGLRMAVNRAANPQALTHVTGLMEFFGEVGMGAAGHNTTTAALQNIALYELNKETKEKVVPTYHLPGEAPMTLPGVPGVRIYVLGPPHDEKMLKQVNPTAKGQEVYTEGAPLNAEMAFWMGVHGDTDAKEEFLFGDSEVRELCYPFDLSLRIYPEEARLEPFFCEHYGFDAEATEQTAAAEDPQRWRRVDDDWLGSAGELALQLDSYTNNTSLVLAFEFLQSKRVVLMAADAQVGNWLSWSQYTWEVTDPDGATRTVNSDDLLARTVFYKVGHHGSHNATLREKGLEKMLSPELTAMIPVDEYTAHEIKGWRRMPFLPLLDRLSEKANGRVLRLDKGLPPKPDDAHEEDWQTFLKNVTVKDNVMDASGGIQEIGYIEYIVKE